jgi:hypothetical protein
VEDPFGDGVAFEADRHFLRPANKGTYPAGGDNDTLHGTGRVIHKDATWFDNNNPLEISSMISR